MNILIIEDEMRIARRLARITNQYFGLDRATITICDDREKGQAYLEKYPVDLLMLDLNLNGEDGFHLMENVVSRSFQTIIVSAYTDKAITAFQYGVLDFVPKPFDGERLGQAFDRLFNEPPQYRNVLRYLAVRRNGEISLIGVAQLTMVTASGIYSKLQLTDGSSVLHDKSLDALERLLPQDIFIRIHRSQIVRILDIKKLIIAPGGRYSLLMQNGENYSVGRSRYEKLRMVLSSIAF